jgi:uncharacterized protein
MIIPIIAIILYLLGNWYVYSRFIEYLNLNHTFISILIITLLFLSMPISMLLSRISNKRNKLYSLGTNWFGILVIALAYTILTDIINIFYYTNYNYLIALILIIISIIYGLINAKKIKIKNIKIKGKTDIDLVLISDIHLGDRYGKKDIEKIINKIISLKPEFVLISGDFFDGNKKIDNNELEPLKKIKVPIYMVMGNHDFYYGEKELMKQLSKFVKILRNETVKFKDINIIGIDDEKIHLLEKIKHLDNSILLYHRPVGIKHFINSKAFLMLSGHTHNGQILPIYIRFIYKYAYGLHKIKNKYIYTSSGVLGWGPKIRFGSNNEIVNIKIIKN